MIFIDTITRSYTTRLLKSKKSYAWKKIFNDFNPFFSITLLWQFAKRFCNYILPSTRPYNDEPKV
jgi:hypothetical protein